MLSTIVRFIASHGTGLLILSTIIGLVIILAYIIGMVPLKLPAGDSWNAVDEDEEREWVSHVGCFFFLIGLCGLIGNVFGFRVVGASVGFSIAVILVVYLRRRQ